MMKVHYIKFKDTTAPHTLLIFGEVDKKRTGWDKSNIVCVRGYDLENIQEINYSDIPPLGMMNIDDARDFWNKMIRFANNTPSVPFTVNHAIYKTMDGSKILTDTDIVRAMDEIAWKQITEEEIIRAKSQGVFSDDYDYSGMVAENLGFDIKPKGDLKFDANHDKEVVHIEDELTESGKIAEQIFDKIGVITENYEQYKE